MATLLEIKSKRGLKYLKLDDGSYVTVWEETQDHYGIGVGYQRFDSEGNPLASELIDTIHDTPRHIYIQSKDEILTCRKRSRFK